MKRLGQMEAAVYLAFSYVGLLLPPHLLLSRWVESGLHGPAGSEENVPEALHLAGATDAVARRMPLATRCLQRSLALVWLLRRRGGGGRLRIGVRRAPTSVSAHAWVEVAGRAVNDSPAHCAQFAVLQDRDERMAAMGILKAERAT